MFFEARDKSISFYRLGLSPGVGFGVSMGHALVHHHE